MAAKAKPMAMTPSYSDVSIMISMNNKSLGESAGTHHNEEPSPASDTHITVQITEDRSTQKTTKHVGQSVTRVKPRDSSRKLSTRVPRAHKEDGTGKEWRLDETKEESNNNKLREVLRSSITSRDGTPQTARGGKIPRRLHLGEEHVGRKLHEQITNEEDGRREVEISTRHAEILLEGTLSGLGEIGAVEEVEEVHDDQGGQHASIDFTEELFLGLVAP